MSQNFRPPQNAGNTVFDGLRLSKLLVASAAVYLLIYVLHVIGRSTETYRDNMAAAADRVLGDGAAGLELDPGVNLWNLLWVAVVLALYALIYIYLRRGKNWARVTGIVLACLGSASALFGFFDAYFYGLYGIAVAVAIIAFVAVNVMWIVAAIRGR